MEPGHETMWSLGMGLCVAWAWDYVEPGHETVRSLGMRLCGAWA